LFLAFAGVVFGYFIPGGSIFGVPMLFVGVFGGALAHPGAGRDIATRAFAIALAGNGFVFASSLWLFTVPAGSYIRPMVWSALVLLVGAACVLAVGVLVLVAMLRGTRRWLSLAAFLVAVESFLLGPELMHGLAYLRGFKLAD
jgi:hypothetical protein